MKNDIEIDEGKKQNNKKKKIIIIIMILIVLILGIFSLTYFIPTIKDEGIKGLLNPTKLTKTEKEYYDLFLPELEKNKECSNNDYNCYFRLYYFEGVDTPLIELEEKSTIKQGSFIPNKNMLFYIKDGKVVTKEYNAVSEIKLLYNTEKDEVDYYLYQVFNYDTNDYTYTVTLLKDIVTESSNPYVVNISGQDKYNTTYKITGEKVSVATISAMFGSHIDNYIDNKVYDQKFSFVDGEKEFKRLFKKALASKYTTKELISEEAKEKGYKEVSMYNINPGQKILNNTSNSNIVNNNQSEQITTKCNSGYVYVSDDNKCYNSSDTKSQINRCGNDEVDLGSDCGKSYPDTTCQSNINDYQYINGICVSNSSLHPKSIECPSGYNILFGNYSGQTFNGACYKYMNPNN